MKEKAKQERPRTITRIVIQLSVAAALTAGSGFAAMFPPRHGDLAASVPFNFVAGEKAMPAGEYIIRTHLNGAIEICEDGVYCATVQAASAVADHGDAQPSLVFRYAGDQWAFVGVAPQGQAASGFDTEAGNTVAARKLCIHGDTGSGLPLSWH